MNVQERLLFGSGRTLTIFLSDLGGHICYTCLQSLIKQTIPIILINKYSVIVDTKYVYNVCHMITEIHEDDNILYISTLPLSNESLLIDILLLLHCFMMYYFII